MRARLPGVTGVAVLGLLVLGGCGGASEPLTTQEYADALVEAEVELKERGGEFAVEWTADLNEAIRDTQDLLESPEWSDDERKQAGESAEELVGVMLELFEGPPQYLQPYMDRVAGLTPPSHLAEPHNTLVEALKEILAPSEEAKKTLENLDTDIESHEELAAFLLELNLTETFAGSGPADSPADSFNEACYYLRDTLEAELGKNVDICGG